ncbi:helix-turn-helix domain-containing protein [Candidatus Woesebacteria bacterium]|nr:helix-turn-helix domain-containing protein [Candidatus Woesebacteria bacterium]
MEKLLKLKEAAEILSVHPNTLRLWDRKGILVAVRIGERKIRRYEISAIKRFIKQNNNEK